MLRAARRILAGAGIPKIEVVRVPGSFEIPVAVAHLVRRAEARPAAVICLGLIWQGKTAHAGLVGEAVTAGLMDLAVETGVPVIHEVLVVQDERQARERCLDPETNRGIEAARTALEMGALVATLGRPRAGVSAGAGA